VELSIVRFLNELGRGTLDPFTELICRVSFLVILWSCCAAAALGLDRRDGRRVAMTVLVALVLHFLVSEAILKHFVLTFAPMRVRPYLAHPAAIVPVGTRFTDSSFPSSHAASTAAALTAFVRWYPKLLPAAIAFVVLMAFCRMHNGMHYPSDVLAGSVLGVLYGMLAVAMVRRWWPLPALQPARTPAES
jgi:undecaprenyl-diphosphatase